MRFLTGMCAGWVWYASNAALSKQRHEPEVVAALAPEDIPARLEVEKPVTFPFIP